MLMRKPGHRPVLLLSLLLALGGCGRAERISAPAAAEVAAGAARYDLAPAPRSDSNRATGRYLLAYKHELRIVLAREQLPAAQQRLLDACSAVADQGCVVMGSSANAGQWPAAEIRLRVRREAMAGLRKQAEGLGEVEHQSSTAEDLSGPLVDTTRRLAMKKSLRDSLLELRGRSQGQLDALLKVTEKLAEVQAEIEAGEGQLAGLRGLLEMDQVQIHLLSRDVQQGQNPVMRALRNFGQDLTLAVGAVISFVAMSLPWLLLLLALPFGWRAARRLWRLGRAQKTG